MKFFFVDGWGLKTGNTQIWSGYVLDLKWIWIGSEMDESGVKTGNTQSSLFCCNSICNGYDFDLKWIWIGNVFFYLQKFFSANFFFRQKFFLSGENHF